MRTELMENKKSLSLYMGHPRPSKSFTRRSDEVKHVYPQVRRAVNYEERLQTEKLLSQAKQKYNYLQERKKQLYRKTAK